MPKRSSSKKQALVTVEPIEPAIRVIRVIRGQRVILDSDLARIYDVSTKVLNQAVKRNENRFPPDFMIRLSPEEWEALRSQIVTSNRSQTVIGSQARLRSQFATSKSRGGRRYLPYAFTEHGAVMAANVLNSEARWR